MLLMMHTLLIVVTMAATVPSNGRLLWFGDNVNIPSGWAEDTDYSDKYLQGGSASFSAPVDGGSDTHYHIMPKHTHGGSVHVHRTNGRSPGSASSTVDVLISGAPTVLPPTVLYSHLHDIKNTPATALVYNENSSATTLTSTTNGPSTIRPLLIKPTTSTKDIPVNAVCYTDENSITGYTVLAASPYEDKYMHIQVNGGDGSVSVTGSDIHQHTGTPVHSHLIAVHTHAAFVLGEGTIQELAYIGPTLETVIGRAHHEGTPGTSLSPSGSDYVIVDSPVTNNQPAFVKLLGIENTGVGAATPVGVVIMFTGDVTTIPSNWVLMDGTNGSLVDCSDKQIKTCVITGEIGDTGGNNTHTHGMAHTHVPAFGSHSHSMSVYMVVVPRVAETGATSLREYPNDRHTHTWNFNNKLPGASDSNDAVTDSADVRAPFRTLVYIKKVKRSGPKVHGYPRVKSLLGKLAA